MTSGEHGTHGPIPNTDPSVAPHAGAIPATRFIAPRDRHSKLGWTHSHQILNTGHYLDLNKGLSVLSIPVLSAATSLIFAASGEQSWEGGIGYDHSKTIQVYENTSPMASPDATTTPAQNEPIRIPGKKARTIILSQRVEMPDVQSFDFDDTPSAHKILNPGAVRKFVKKVAAMSDTNKGSTLSCMETGTSSDEDRQEKNGGIGTKNEKNVQLAADYGKFAIDFTVKEFINQHLPRTALHVGRAHEVVSSAVTTQRIIQVRQNEGFKKMFGLIEQWKTNPNSLLAHSRQVLQNNLARFRGAIISCKRFIRGVKATTEINGNQSNSKKNTTNAANSTTTNNLEPQQDLSEYTVEQHRRFPFVWLGFPIFRSRRGRRQDLVTVAPPPPPLPLAPTGRLRSPSDYTTTAATDIPTVASDPNAIVPPVVDPNIRNQGRWSRGAIRFVRFHRRPHP